MKSKHDDNFCWLNCLHSFKTKNKLGSHKRTSNKKNVCDIVTPSEGIRVQDKILAFNQYQTSDLIRRHLLFMHIFYLWLKIDECKNNLEKSSTA